ncbi:unnamed protein product [Mytilus edulis]|uniref:C3H1-type domain-containing protein n=1 Tax=Mytilus edulis TaxID=6550 RepID=A0A8S3RJ85_MYTED|nr:unnamed protein product [Mytilus edulis]
MPKVKPGQSKKGKNKAQRESPSPLSPEVEEALIARITESVIQSMNRNEPVEEIPEQEDQADENGEQEGMEMQENEWQEDLPATNSISTPIAAMVDPSIKHKIWQDKYIDLSVLLPHNCLPNAKKNGLQFQVSGNSTLSLVSNKPRFYISSIEQWTTAFLRFMAIYSEKFPESTAYLAKHAEIVRDLASTQSSNNSWLTYDQQVRMDRQIRGVPWHSLNMEFYIMATRPQQGSPQGSRPFRPFRNRQWNSSNRQEGSSTDETLPKGVCWNYNKDGFCRIKSCKFAHRCGGCKGNHPIIRCAKRAAPSKQQPQSTPKSDPRNK